MNRPPERTDETARLRAGILGPGRTRNGLGPFLATWLERSGVTVVAAAGRGMARTQVAVDDLAARLDHSVEARDGVAALVAPGDLDVLVVAAPVGAHLSGLTAAADAGLHVLCEKPLVRIEEFDAAVTVVERIAAQQKVVQENCQWPQTLGAFDVLHPGVRSGAAPREFAMRLSPSQPEDAMLTDSLSHFLSLVQELVPIDASTSVTQCAVDRGADGRSARLDFGLAGPFEEVRCRFELVVCETQPRPAWFAIDGHRMERRVRTADYAMFACDDAGREVPMDDPLGQLVYRFAASAREPQHDRVQRDARAILDRLRLYRDLVVVWRAQV